MFSHRFFLCLYKMGPLLLAWLVLGLLPLQSHAKIFADKKNKLYHRESCPEVKLIKAGNLRIFDSEPEAGSRGFFACLKCIPPSAPASLKEKEPKKMASRIGRDLTYTADHVKNIYHQDWCALVASIPARGRRPYASAKSALDDGYEPCKECNPPARFQSKAMITTAGEEIKPMEKKQAADAMQGLPGEESK